MEVPSRATLLSFAGGIALALSAVFVTSVVRHRGACRGTECNDAAVTHASPAPDVAAARPADRGSVYVMRSEAGDPAERALADALRAHDESMRQPPAASIDSERSEPAAERVQPSPDSDGEQSAVTASVESLRQHDHAVSTPNLDGWWLVTNTIESTDYSAYDGLRLAYRMWLHRDGDHVSGRGFKWEENGRRLSRSQRTPIFLSGTVRGGQVDVRFVEHGQERVSEGRFQWQLSRDARLQGRFASDVANTSGRSEARRSL